MRLGLEVIGHRDREVDRGRLNEAGRGGVSFDHVITENGAGVVNLTAIVGPETGEVPDFTHQVRKARAS